MRIELYPDSANTESNRRSTRVESELKSVSLITDADTCHRGEVVDESFGGIGILFEEYPALEPGQEVEVSYSGLETCAVVRHACADELGKYRVGLEWKAESLARAVRELSTLQPTSSMDEKTTGFLRVLPGGVYMMWKFLEAEKWLELGDTTERLRREAHLCGINWLDGLIADVLNSLSNGSSKLTIRKEVCYLFEECIGIVRESSAPGSGTSMANTIPATC